MKPKSSYMSQGHIDKLSHSAGQ